MTPVGRLFPLLFLALGLPLRLSAQRWSTLDKVSAAASVVAIAGDCATSQAAFSRGAVERTNRLLLGRRPSAARLFASCAVGVGATFELAHITKRRALVFGAIALIESAVVVWNLRTMPGR